MLKLLPQVLICQRGLLNTEPLELARQLTLIESQLFLNITPAECVAHGTGSGDDNIERIISTSNKVILYSHYNRNFTLNLSSHIAEWVAQ
jgi:hypothetical protein